MFRIVPLMDRGVKATGIANSKESSTMIEPSAAMLFEIFCLCQTRTYTIKMLNILADYMTHFKPVFGIKFVSMNSWRFRTTDTDTASKHSSVVP